MESADPHAARVDGKLRGDARQHFLGGLVGEGHCQNAIRADVAGLDQPDDARGEHARLARSGASQDQRVLVGQRDGRKLFRIEVVEQGHSGIPPVLEASGDFTARPSRRVSVDTKKTGLS